MATLPDNVIIMEVYNDADLSDPVPAYNGEQSPPPVLLKPSAAGTKEFVTVVSVEDSAGGSVVSPGQSDRDNYVTLLEVDETPNATEEVLVYRLPGERLGMALKFVGGTAAADNVSRVFIQSITPESPASRAQWKISPIKEGDEILEIGDTPVTSMTRLDCVTLLRDSPVCIKLLLRHQGETSVGRARKNPPPPIPPRKSSIGGCNGSDLAASASTTSVRQHVELFEKHASGIERSPSLRRPSIPPPLPPRRPKCSYSDSEEQSQTPAFPGMSLSMRLPGWEELMRKRSGSGDKGDRPVQPDFYVDLLAEEDKKLLECESDDTGSSVSTVIEKFSRASTANSSFSEHTRQQSLDRPSHTFDLEKVLSPFEQLERELDGHEETCVDDDEQDLDFVDDPGILNDGKDALCDVLGLPSPIAPPESFQDMSSPQQRLNEDICSDTEYHLTSEEDQESRPDTLSPLQEQEESSDQEIGMEVDRRLADAKESHVAAAMALDKLLQLDFGSSEPSPRRDERERSHVERECAPEEEEMHLADANEQNSYDDDSDDIAFELRRHAEPLQPVQELLSYSKVVKTTEHCSSSTVVIRNGLLDSRGSQSFFEALEEVDTCFASPANKEILSERTITISSQRRDELVGCPASSTDIELEPEYKDPLRTYQSSACVTLTPGGSGSGGYAEPEGTVNVASRFDGGADEPSGSDDSIPDDMLDSCGGYRDETDDAVARATEDVVMEGRLLDSPDTDVCLPGFDVAAGMYGVLPPPPEEERAAVEGCCSGSQHPSEAADAAALLEGAGSDMDTIPEEETGSELLTESSQLDSDRSEPEDSSESPLPRDTPDEGSEEENKSDWALPSTVGQVDDLAPSGDEEILSPIEHETPSPFREREEKSRTPDSEDPMSSDEGGGGGFPSLLLRRLPPDGHEFPTAYSEPSLPKAPPPPSAAISAPSSQEDALPLKKPMHVYEDSGIFSDDPLSSLSASEGEEKTKVTATKSPKECCSRQGDGRAAAAGEEAPWTNGVDKDSTSSPPPPAMIAAEPLPAGAASKEDTKCLPATFASTPLPTPAAQYSSPLIPDRRASAEATQKRYSGMLASMLETTKFGTKLKGLVIPDKPKAPATVAKTLPVIVSNSVVPASNKMVPALEDSKPRRDSKHSPPSPKHTTLLADPPWKTKEVAEVPKYSPAFKRRSLQVSKSCDVSPVRGGSQNAFQFSLTHSKPVTPVLPETPVMSPPPLSYTSSGSRSRSNSSSSTFSNPSSSGCSLEIAKKSRADSFAMSDSEQKQTPTVVSETPVANGKPYGQSPLLERYLSSSTYDEKNAEAKVSRQNSVKSVSSTDSRSDVKTITNGHDGPSAKYNSERRSSAEIQRKNSLGSADAVIQEATAPTVSASSSPPQVQRLATAETKCDESRKAARTWETTSLKDAKTKFRSMDDRSWNSQFRRNSCEQPVYSTRVNSVASLNADQRTRSLDLKESPSEAWQKSVRASQLGQQKTVLKKTVDSADSAKSFKALAQKWEQRSQDAQGSVPQAPRKDIVVTNGKSHPPVAPKPHEYNRPSQYIVANGKASPSTSAEYSPSVQLRSQKYSLSRPASMYEERDKPRLSTDWPESHPSSYLRTKVDKPSSATYRSSKNCSSSLSVNDIKKAFETEAAKVPPRTLASLRAMRSEQQLPLPEHRRFSSIDSNDSGNSTASREQYSSMTSLASTSSLISPQELQQLIDEANQSLDEAGASGHDIHVVILHKDSPTSGLGVTLAGGSDYETKEITVHKVIAGGLADRDGRIRKADRILSINGKTMKNVTHKDAIDILKSPRQEVVLVISRDGRQSLRTTPNISRASSLSSVLDVVDEPEVSASASPVTEAQQSPTPAKHEKIVLVKDGLGLGFTLEGGKDSPLGDKPLVVKRIFRGGAAERDGRLLVGDELVSINAQPVCLMTRTEAWNFLKKLPDGPLTLQVVRRAC